MMNHTDEAERQRLAGIAAAEKIAADQAAINLPEPATRSTEPAPPALVTPTASLSPGQPDAGQADAGRIRFDLRARLDDILNRLSDENLSDLYKVAERLLAQQAQDELTAQA